MQKKASTQFANINEENRIGHVHTITVCVYRGRHRMKTNIQRLHSIQIHHLDLQKFQMSTATCKTDPILLEYCISNLTGVWYFGSCHPLMATTKMVIMIQNS